MSALTAPLPATPTLSQTAAGAGATSTSQFDGMNAQSFMELLTTELQHQDPTNPVDETQLAGQMAQFSMASGINTLNSNVEALVQAQTAGQLSGASALIGKQVATSGNTLLSDASGQAHGAFSLDAPATNVAVHVTDASGKTVGTVPLGSLGGGVHTFNWPAPSPDAAYQFTVSAQGADGGPANATPYSLYQVSGVTQTSSGIALSLAGNPDPLPISQIAQVL